MGRLQAGVRVTARIGQGEDVVTHENLARRLAEGDQVGRADAVKLINAEAELAGEACVFQIGQNGAQVRFVLKPDAVRYDLVEPEAKLGRAARQRDDEFGIKKRLSSGE